MVARDKETFYKYVLIPTYVKTLDWGSSTASLTAIAFRNSFSERPFGELSIQITLLTDFRAALTAAAPATFYTRLPAPTSFSERGGHDG